MDICDWLLAGNSFVTPVFILFCAEQGKEYIGLSAFGHVIKNPQTKSWLVALVLQHLVSFRLIIREA